MRFAQPEAAFAVLDPDTGDFGEEELAHEADAVERFYSGLSRPVTVDFETTDYTLWFHALMQKLGHTLLVGGAAKGSHHRGPRHEDGPA